MHEQTPEETKVLRKHEKHMFQRGLTLIQGPPGTVKLPSLITLITMITPYQSSYIDILFFLVLLLTLYMSLYMYMLG